MSETTPPQKLPATHHTPKSKVESESHLPPSGVTQVESSSLIQDELLTTDPSSILRPAESAILHPPGSSELSARSQQHQSGRNTSSAKPLAASGFAGRNFAGLPTRGPIQTKLTVGAAHDPYEEEADQVAEQVMRLPTSTFESPAGAGEPNDGGRSIQRAFEEEEELQAKPLTSAITPLVQRIPAKSDEAETQPESLVQRVAEEEDELQTKRGSAADSFEMGDDFAGRVAATRGGGAPLPDPVRTFMEPRFGADFSGVRVHAGSEAADLNQQVSAQAFTLGNDIYLGEGKTDLSSDSGKQLLAHELTHVVQQGSAGEIKRASQPAELLKEEEEKKRGTALATGATTALFDGGSGQASTEDQATSDPAAPPQAAQSNKGNGKEPAPISDTLTPTAAPQTTQSRNGNGKGTALAADTLTPTAAPQTTQSRNGNGKETALAADTLTSTTAPQTTQSRNGNGKETAPASDTLVPTATPQKTQSRNGNGKEAPPASDTLAPAATPEITTSGNGKQAAVTPPATSVTTPESEANKENGKGTKKEIASKEAAGAGEQLKEQEKDRQEKTKAGPEGKVATPEGEKSMAELGNIMADMEATQTEEQGKAETEVGDLESQGQDLAQDQTALEGEVTQTQEELSGVKDELAQHEQGEVEFAPLPEEASANGPEVLLKDLGVDTQPIEDKKRQDAELSNGLIEEFIAECSAKASTLATIAETIPERIEPVLAQTKATIETAIAQASDTTAATIEQARAQAQSDAEAAHTEIEAKYTATVTAVETATQTSRASIETDYATKLQGLLNIETTKSGEIDTLVAGGTSGVSKAASDMAQAARQTGAQYAAKYQAESYPEPTFLEGSDYYERKRQAKVSAAKQVSEQYANEFAAKGKEVGGQLAGSVGDVKGELKAKLDSARQAIESEKTAALAELEQATQNALTQATDTQTAQLQAVDESLTATLESLDQLETSLLTQITETGQQQMQAAEQAAQQSQASLQQAVQEAVASLNTSISEMESEVRAIPAPQPAQIEQFIAQARGQFDNMYTQSASGLETQISTAGETVMQTGQQAAQSLDEIGQQAAPQAEQISANFTSSVDGLKQSAIDSFSQLETDHTTAVEERAAQALDNFTAALTQAQQDADKITTCLKSGVDGFVKDFKNSLQPTLQGLPKKIEDEATAAANKVQPAWKKVVAFIAVIIITVVVAVAIAALVASGVGIGLGLLLAAGIGALGGVAKGMINNWAAGEPITKDLLKNAVMGALDGMLQFVGGRFVAGLKLPDTGWKQVLVKKAVDTVSGIVTDTANLAWDGKLTWETAGKMLLNNLVKGLVSFGTGTALDKWNLPKGSFEKYLAESGMGTLGSTVSKMTNSFLIEGEPFSFDKAMNILGESAAESFLTNAVQAGFDKAKVEDRLKGKFDGWFGDKPSPIIDPSTGQPFGQKPEKGTILDADGNPIKPTSPLDKIKEAYDNLGKWARGETEQPHILGPDGQPVNSKGEPIPDKSEEPGVGLVDVHGKPLIDTDGKPIKPGDQPGSGLVDKDGNPLSGSKPKTDEPDGGLVDIHGQPLFGSKPANSPKPVLLGADGQPIGGSKAPPPKIMDPATYERIQQFKSGVPGFDYTTPKGKPPAFWSGGEDVAGQAARQAGFATMEDTSGGQSVQAFTTGIKNQSDWSDQKPIWSQASAAYAHQVGKQYGGTDEPVYIFINDAKFKPDSVYMTVEKPILLSYGVKVVEVHGPPFNVPGK